MTRDIRERRVRGLRHPLKTPPPIENPAFHDPYPSPSPRLASPLGSHLVLLAAAETAANDLSTGVLSDAASLEAAGAAKAIVRAMKTHAADVETQSDGCCALM